MDQVFSKENKTLKNTGKLEKILEKSGKSQGILSVRKSGNPDPVQTESQSQENRLGLWQIVQVLDSIAWMLKCFMKMKSLSVLRLWKKFFTCSHAKACKRIPSDVEGENLSYAAQSTLLCTSNSILK